MANDTLLLVGSSSFLCRALLTSNPDLKVRVMPGRQAPEADWFENVSTVVNFAMDPALQTGPYDAKFDVDLHIAEHARRAGAHYVMLSSRKVYAPDSQVGATEDSPVEGMDHYGRSKLCTETVLREILGDERLTILRIANVIGFEYRRANRMSFMGYMLTGLRDNGVIEFTTGPSGRRDFMNEAYFARILRQILDRQLVGVFNLGSGHGVEIGKLAEWVIEGYGEGRIEVKDPTVSGEFLLDISKLRRSIEADFSIDELRKTCVGLGQKLRQF